MREKFEDRALTGQINIKCKNDDGTFRMWTADKGEVIDHITGIVNRYIRMGYRLTLRQLHYQLVTKNWIVNHDTAYSKLGDILDDCRYAGVIDWDMIEDRGRVPHLPYHADSVAEALEELHDYYRRDRQEGQRNLVEVWTEKDALSGILKRPAEKYHVRLVVNKGYSSSSALYRAYQRILEAIKDGQTFTILYFGDHDPSGLDMVRDIRDRLMKFLCSGTQLRNDLAFMNKLQENWDATGMNVHELAAQEYLSYKAIDRFMDGSWSDDEDDLFDTARIRRYIDENDIFRVIPMGLTMEQIKKYKLPPNPAKLTDGRAKDYIAEHGRICWEVDALDPEVLTAIVDRHIRSEIDIDLYDAMLESEETNKVEIRGFIDNATKADDE